MNVDDNKPFPVRLGELKKPLAAEASSMERSLHWLIRKILKKHVEGSEAEKKPRIYKPKYETK